MLAFLCRRRSSGTHKLHYLAEASGLQSSRLKVASRRENIRAKQACWVGRIIRLLERKVAANSREEAGGDKESHTSVQKYSSDRKAHEAQGEAGGNKNSSFMGSRGVRKRRWVESCRNLAISLSPIFFVAFFSSLPFISALQSNWPSWEEKIVSELSGVSWSRGLIVNK